MERYTRGFWAARGVILLLLLLACYKLPPPAVSPEPSLTVFPGTVCPILTRLATTPVTPTTTTSPVPARQTTVSGIGIEHVYVTTPGSAAVSVVDGPGHRVIATITGNGLHSPTGIALGPEEKIYVANFFSPTLAVIDPRMNVITSIIALNWDELVGVAASSEKIYVTSNDGGVIFITPGQNVAVKYIPLPGLSPSTVIADERRIYVAYVGLEPVYGGSHIAVLDGHSVRLVLDIQVSGMELEPGRISYLRGGGTIHGLGLTASGQLYCIMAADRGYFLVIDAATGTVIQEREIPLQPDYYAFALDAQLAVAPNGKVYIANPGADTVLVFDPVAGEIVRTIPVGDQPTSIAIGTADLAYVTNQGDDTISVINIMTDEIIGEPIHVGREPLGLVIYHPRD